MLQWTGGSRRKVYASRNSTQSRQRQYFEQKKRQQQQNQNDVAGGQASHDKQPRSLDVININNLATPSGHRDEPANAEGAIVQFDFTLSEASPTEALKDITSLYNVNTNETGSKPRLSSSSGHQDAVAAANSHEQTLGHKISPSTNYSTRQQNQNLGLESEISLIDWATYEGSKNKSTGQPAREAHVSFSVKGLGHMKMETPPHSPIPTKRDLPLAPKAMRFAHKAKRSIPFDVTKALDSIDGINMLNERRPPDKISKIFDESDNVKRKQYNCYFPGSFKNNNADLNLEDEDMFYEPRAKKDLLSKRSRSGGTPGDENSDIMWRIDQLSSMDHFPTSRDNFDTFDYGCQDRYSPERRNSTKSSSRFDDTGFPSSHDLFFDHSLMDDDKVTELFEWERRPPSKKISNSNNTCGPSAWPFDMGDDSEKSRSPISEESCSSSVARKDRPFKKPSPSVKHEMDKKDEFHMSLDELDIPNMDAHLHRMSVFDNPGKVANTRTTDQKQTETGYWPERVTEQPMKDRPFKKPSPSVKHDMNKKDEFHMSFHMSLDELDIPNMDAHVDGMSLFNNPEKVGHKRTTDRKKIETVYWPERVTEQPMKDRPFKKPSPSVKHEMDKKDEFLMSLDELDIPNMDAHLHGMSLFNNPEKVGHKRTTDQKKIETGYWPERVTEQPRTREPRCRLSLNEKFSGWGSPTPHLKGRTGLSTAMHEDTPSFKSASDIDAYQMESTEKKPDPKVHSAFHGPDNIIFEDGIRMQRPVSDIFGDKTVTSNPFHVKDLRSDIHIDNLFGHNEDKKQEDNFSLFSNRKADIFPAKKAGNSAIQTVDGHSNLSHCSGTDSFRHGFTPKFSFQGSEPNTFWEDSHVSNGTFLGELSGVLARENSNKNNGKIEVSEKPDTKMYTKKCQPSENHKNERSRAQPCSDDSGVYSYTEVQKDTCAETKQIPASSCLQEVELCQAHELVRLVTSENLDDPVVDNQALLHLRNKTQNVPDKSEINAVFQSPFVGELGIEKKIIASVSPNNNDVQYQFMLEQRVLQRLCVQKIVVPTPMMDKLDKDKREDGSHVLAKSV